MPFLAEALDPAAARWGARSRPLTWIRVFCWAQLLMVVANLGRIPVLSTPDRDFPIGFNDLCLGVILVAAVLTVRSWKEVKIDRIILTALLFAVIGGGSAIWSVSRFDMTAIELFVSLSFLGRWLFYFSLYAVMINVAREEHIELVWWAVETMLVIFALFGVFQSAFLPNFTQMIYHDNRSFNWDEQRHRLMSTVLEPNIAGTLLMIGLLVQAARITVGAPVKAWRVFVLFTALTLTISRSAALGMFAGMMVVLGAQGLTRRLAKTLFVAASLLTLVSPLLIQYLINYGKFSIGAGTSAGARLSTWLEAIRIVSDYPIFGIGFNAYRYALQHYGVEILGASSYGTDGGLLFITAMTGFVGLTVYCAMLWQIIARCRSIWRDYSVPANQRGWALGTAAATVGIVFASVSVNALLTTFDMEILSVLWGLTFVIAAARAKRAMANERVGAPRLVAVAA